MRRTFQTALPKLLISDQRFLRARWALPCIALFIVFLMSIGDFQLESSRIAYSIPKKGHYSYPLTGAALLALSLLLIPAALALFRSLFPRLRKAMPWQGEWLLLGLPAIAFLVQVSLPHFPVQGALFLGCGFLSLMLFRRPRPEWLTLSPPWENRLPLLLAGAAFLLLAFENHWAYGRLPYVVDSMSQWFQAEILLSGRFLLPPPPIEELFWEDTAVITDDRWFSQFPAGHIFLLLAGKILQAEWLLNPLAGALLILVCHGIGKELYGGQAALLGAFLLFLSPYFHLMQAGFMNHGTAGVLLAGGCWLTLRIQRAKNPALTASLVGVCFGWAFITRPLTTVGLITPLFLYSLWAIAPKLPRLSWLVLAFFLAFGSVNLIQLLYNAWTTGNPLTTGYQLTPLKSFQVGFSEDFRPLDGFVHCFNNLYRMNDYLLFYPGGSYLFIGMLVLFGRMVQGDWLLLAMTFGLSSAYFIYGYQDFWYGPRFLYEALPMLCLLSARGLLILERLVRLGLGKSQDQWRRSWLPFFAVAVIALPAGIGAYRLLHHVNGFREAKWEVISLANNQQMPEKALIAVPQYQFDYSFLVNHRYPSGPLLVLEEPDRFPELLNQMPGWRLATVEEWKAELARGMQGNAIHLPGEADGIQKEGIN